MKKISPKRTTQKSTFILLLACLCLPAGSPVQFGSAAQDAVRPQKPLQHEVTVTLKLIQVYVTDKKGNPIRNLKKDDFVLTDDGKEQKLTEFEEHVITLPAEAAPAEERVVRTPVVSSPRLLGRKFFFFFDYAYSNPQGALKIKDAALKFLDTRLSPLDEIGVVSFSWLKRLRVHLYLTTDHQKVKALVAKIGARDSSDRNEDLEDKYKRALDSGQLADARSGKLSFEKVLPPEFKLEYEERWQANNYLDSLIAFAQALKYEQGQKHLILFSDGIPYRTLYRGDKISLQDGKPPNQFSELSAKSETLLKELAASNIAVYALDTYTDPIWGGISSAPALETGAGTLQKMSDATGGRYWGDIFNYPAHVEKIQTLTGSYYVLGYPVDEKWDGQYHKIKVRVKQPGCEVRAQGGYFNPKPFSDYTDFEKQIHLVDVALAENPLSQAPLRFSMAAFACSTAKENNLCLAASIPLERVREMAGKKVEVVSMVFNAADDIVELDRSEEDFTKVQQREAYLLFRLTAPAGAYRCRIVVRNLETGRAAIAASPAVVPEPKADGIQIFPPLLLRPDRGAYYVKGALFKTAAGKGGTVLSSPGFPFDAAQYAPYLEKILWSGSEVWAVIRCATANITAPEIKLSAFLFDKFRQDNIVVPLTVISRIDEKETKVYFVRLLIPDVEPDEYTFHCLAEETTGGTSSDIASDFKVERLQTIIRPPEN